MEIAICLGYGFLCGAVLALFQALMEHMAFSVFNKCEGAGIVTRVAPSVATPRRTNYSWESFWAVSLGFAPGFVLMAAFRERYKENCRWNEYDMLGGWVFNLALMIIQDACFFAIHTLQHKVKALYTLIHQTHHYSQLDVTVYSTSYGEVLDTMTQFGTFYLGLALYLYACPSWNLWAFVIHLLHILLFHTIGHCGYNIPAWIHVPFSMGITLIPGSQRPHHHYIHHLDPRYNRSLYFLWWDMIFGTYQNKHSKIPSANTKLKS